MPNIIKFFKNCDKKFTLSTIFSLLARVDAFEVDWDTFEVDSKKYPEDHDILADVREELEYDVSKVETVGRNLIEETPQKPQTASSSPETSDNEADSSSSDDEVEFANEFRSEMIDAFAFARYVDEEPDEELNI